MTKAPANKSEAIKKPPLKKAAVLKKPKDKTPTWYKKQCDIIFSHYIRRIGHCEWCGRSDAQLQCSHIIPRTNLPLRCHKSNAICLCVICHLYRWHKHPLAAAEWFDRAYPGRWEHLKRLEHDTLGNPVNWKEEWLRLREI